MMILSEKSNQNISDWIQLSFNKIFEFSNKKGLFLVKNWEIQVILYMIMLTRSSERIPIPSRYTGDM